MRVRVSGVRSSGRERALRLKVGRRRGKVVGGPAVTATTGRRLHSLRSASVGFTRVARRAGIQQASNAARSSSSALVR